MATKIGNSASPYSSQRVNLSGTIYTLVLKYSFRMGCWYLDVLNGDGTKVILAGLKVVPNQNLTGRYNPNPLPDGNLWCLRRQNTNSGIGRLNLGAEREYALYWLTPEEESRFNTNGNISI